MQGPIPNTHATHTQSVVVNTPTTKDVPSKVPTQQKTSASVTQQQQIVNTPKAGDWVGEQPVGSRGLIPGRDPAARSGTTPGSQAQGRQSHTSTQAPQRLAGGKEGLEAAVQRAVAYVPMVSQRCLRRPTSKVARTDGRAARRTTSANACRRRPRSQERDRQGE